MLRIEFFFRSTRNPSLKYLEASEPEFEENAKKQTNTNREQQQQKNAKEQTNTT